MGVKRNIIVSQRRRHKVNTGPFFDFCLFYFNPVMFSLRGLPSPLHFFSTEKFDTVGDKGINAVIGGGLVADAGVSSLSSSSMDELATVAEASVRTSWSKLALGSRGLVRSHCPLPLTAWSSAASTASNTKTKVSMQ